MKAFKIKIASDYYITENGDVYSRNYNGTGRIKKIKPAINSCGYLFVNIKNKKRQADMSGNMQENKILLKNL